jgi:hypothetical protein
MINKKLSLRIARFNRILLVIYSIIFIGATLRFYEVWFGWWADLFAFLMMWSFYMPALVEDPSRIAQLTLGFPALQWSLPVITSLWGIILNRTNHLIVHVGLMLVILASLVIIFWKGAYILST